MHEANSEGTMRLSREEAARELEGVIKVLEALRARRRILQEQAAKYGDTVSPQILIEIEGITEQIRGAEEDAERLEIQSVEDQLSLNETEYRLELARAWNTPEGYPSVEGFASLELKRLLLKITLVRATELEREIRESLAKERLSRMGNISDFEMIGRKGDATEYYRGLAEIIKPLVFLHRKTTLSLFELYECNWEERDFDRLFDLLMQSGNRVTGSIQGSILERFIEALKANFIKPEN